MSHSGPKAGEPTLTELVERAIERDAEAWRLLVRRTERVVWRAVNVATSDPQLRQDAAAATWLRLAENLVAIREPERLAGWLSTTAANEVRAAGRRQQRLIGTDPAVLERQAQPDERDEHAFEQIEAHDIHATVRAAFSDLDGACRELLTLLILHEPPLSYADIEERLGRPRGSLGPTRQRCLDKLRRSPVIARLLNRNDQ